MRLFPLHHHDLRRHGSQAIESQLLEGKALFMFEHSGWASSPEHSSCGSSRGKELEAPAPAAPLPSPPVLGTKSVVLASTCPAHCRVTSRWPETSPSYTCSVTLVGWSRTRAPGHIPQLSPLFQDTHAQAFSPLNELAMQSLNPKFLIWAQEARSSFSH